MYNASEHIEACLDHLFATEHVSFDVTLVDDCSTDDTRTLAARYPGATIVQQPEHRGASAARNAGIEATRAPIVLFIDSDVLIPPDLARYVIEFFRDHPDVAILQGRYDDEPYYRNPLSQYKHFVFSFRGLHPTRHGEAYSNYVHTACVAVRREVLKEVRFNEALVRGEDVDFGQRCARAGHRIVADSDLAVGHKKRYTLISYTRYQVKVARDLMTQFLQKRIEHGEQPFYGHKNPLYKKLWLLRPLVSGLLVLGVLWLALGGAMVAGIAIGLVVALSFVLEAPFRFYLLRRAPVVMSIVAWPLYFYDGLITGLGLVQAIFFHRRAEVM